MPEGFTNGNGNANGHALAVHVRNVTKTFGTGEARTQEIGRAHV